MLGCASSLLLGMGQSRTRDGGIPLWCPLSTMFIVALYLPWCRYPGRRRRCSLKYMLTISSLFLGILAYFCVLLGSLLGPAHLLVESAAEIGFQWDSCVLGWERPGLLVLSNFAGPVQHLRAAVLDAWRKKVSADPCARKGFRGGPFLDIPGTLQLLNAGSVRERLGSA